MLADPEYPYQPEVLADIAVRVNDRVKAGDLLLRLEDEEPREGPQDDDERRRERVCEGRATLQVDRLRRAAVDRRERKASRLIRQNTSSVIAGEAKQSSSVHCAGLLRFAPRNDEGPFDAFGSYSAAND